jgi:tetratricopeptide (TPR) repeat protein
MRICKKAVFLAVFSFFFILQSLPAADRNSQDDYGNAADYLNDIYGIDDNAGLTAFPILNIPMGGRSEGMATAFSAVSDDVSFIEYNPAGSSILDKTELAFFHNNWIADTKIEGIAYATRFGHLGVAAGAKWLYTPFTEYNLYGERVSNGYYSEGAAILNASYNFLSGFYFSGVSVGVSLKGAFRIMPDYTGDDDIIIGGSGLSQSAVMGMADIGALTRFNLFKFYPSRDKNAAAAIVVRNLGPPALDEPLPTVINASFAYNPLRPLIIAFDFNLPINMMDVALSEKPNMALGLSLNVTNFLSMRAGVLIKAGSSRVSVGSAIKLDRLAIDINYTLDLLTQLQPMNRISLGVRFDLGDGGRRQRSRNVDELYLLGLDAYSRGDFAEARQLWEEVLRIDPRFEPAKESLAMLNNRENLRQRIEDLYSLD